MTGAEVAGLRTRRPSALAVGVMVWLASELMFFAGLFASYFTIRAASATWPPPGVELDPIREGIFTLVLITSSFTMQAAEHNLKEEHRPAARKWIVVTLVLGAVFLGNEVLEWLTIGFTPSTDAYGSLFFLLTGFHGLHVFIGLLLMIGLLGRIVGPGPDPGDEPAVAAVTYYWHFVDVVWVALYVTIFLIQ
ncbi:MAG: heme-copper oxidase subunit III [Actinobacteria bacterium]|nr:heme-copper oxidase subunit III [Actinomycetota bacterium]